MARRVNRRTVLSALGLAVCVVGGGACLRSSSRSTPADVPDLETPYLGEPRQSADIVVACWEDFLCPHCRQFEAQVLPRLRRELLGEESIRIERHDFPIPVDQTWSWNVAMAGRSTQQRAGLEAFWAFTTRAYSRQSDLTDFETLRTIAAAAGAEPSQVVEDVRADRHRPTVAADRAAGQEQGVDGTPAVFVNGRPTAPTADAIISRIRDAS